MHGQDDRERDAVFALPLGSWLQTSSNHAVTTCRRHRGLLSSYLHRRKGPGIFRWSPRWKGERLLCVLVGMLATSCNARLDSISTSFIVK